MPPGCLRRWALLWLIWAALRYVEKCWFSDRSFIIRLGLVPNSSGFMPPRKKAAAVVAAPTSTSDAPDNDAELQQLLPVAEIAEQAASGDGIECSSAAADAPATHSNPGEATCGDVADIAAGSAQSQPHDSSSPHHSPTKSDTDGQGESKSGAATAEFNLVFLGTGVSTTIPKLSHFLSGSCAVCNDAAARPFSKNRRNNVNALITVPIAPEEAAAAAADNTDDAAPVSSDRFWNASSTAKTSRYICIDFSPTIRDSAMRFFPAAGCRSLDAVARPLFPYARFISFDSPCRCCCPMFTSMPLVAS